MGRGGGESVDHLVELLLHHRPTVALTGAGISTESGIPDFRGRGGLWTRIDPMQLSAGAFRRDPALFWQRFHRAFSTRGPARPNPGHLALAHLEEAGYLRSIITQNIDGLHQAAGSKAVIEIHGNLRRARCRSCGATVPLREALDRLASCEVPECACGGRLRPDVVLFEDPMPLDFRRAEREAAAAGLLLVVGSSLAVWPAAGLVDLAPVVAVVNNAPTPADRRAAVVARGSAGEVLSALADRLRDQHS